MKHRVVLFTRNNAIIKKVEDVSPFQYRSSKRVLINPDLSLVAGTPPHYWKVVSGRVVPMTFPEKERVDVDHKIAGVDNEGFGAVKLAIHGNLKPWNGRPVVATVVVSVASVILFALAYLR